MSGTPSSVHVAFTSELPDAFYSVSLLIKGPTGGATIAPACMWHVDSQDVAGFTFSCRHATSYSAYAFLDASVIAYIAIPHN